MSLLVIIHELGHFIAAKKNGVYVEEFGFGLPPRIWGIKRGETLFSLNALPFGGFVKVLGEEREELKSQKLSPAMQKRTFASKNNAVKLTILTAGVFANFLLGWVVISALFVHGVPTPTKNVIIESVVERSPAGQAGLQKNDIVTAIVASGERIDVSSTDKFITEIKKYTGTPIELVISRESAQMTKTITPRANPPKGEGALGVVLTPFMVKKYSLLQAPVYGLIEAVRITAMITKELGKAAFTFVVSQEAPAEIAGPVGIAKITSQALQYGPLAVLQLLSLLSLNLAVINILPFPALDGGRVAFVIYEMVTKKPIPSHIERKFNMVGFAVLLSLIALITVNDILKLI